MQIIGTIEAFLRARAQRLRARISLQAGAIFFIAFVCLSLLGAEAQSLWQERSDQIAYAKATTENLARSIAGNAENTLLATDGILVGLVERLETDGTGPAALERLHRL